MTFNSTFSLTLRFADPEADLVEPGDAESPFQNRRQPGFELIAEGGDPGLIGKEIAAIDGVDIVLGNNSKGDTYKQVLQLAERGDPCLRCGAYAWYVYAPGWCWHFLCQKETKAVCSRNLWLFVHRDRISRNLQYTHPVQIQYSRRTFAYFYVSSVPLLAICHQAKIQPIGKTSVNKKYISRIRYI